MIDGEISKFTVEESGRSFAVHKKLLLDRIPGFHNISRFRATEGAVDVLLGWVYKRSVRRLKAVSEDEGAKTLSWKVEDVCKLAENLELPDFHDEVIDQLLTYYHKTETTPTIDDICRMYRKVSAGSPLRKVCAYFLVGIAEQKGRHTEIHAAVTENSELSIEFLTSLSQGAQGFDPRKMPRCRFHWHEKDGTCYVDKK